MNPPDAPERRRLLDLRSGWPLVVAACLVLLLLAWWGVGILHPDRRSMLGDGADVSTYGFDLTTCLVPREQLVASGLPRDGFPALTDPPVLSQTDVDQLSRQLRKAHQGKLLVAPDRVIGVVIEGVARAYPLKIMNWHQVVNDTLAGQPILVTYDPLCDSAVVFERERADGVAEFGFSGLLYNSNLLMYDRCPTPDQSSLWSQLQFRAIAGPAAGRGETLRIIPAVLVQYGSWKQHYPDTTVLGPVRSRTKIYRRSFGPYHSAAELLFPVSPLPTGPRPLKSRVLAIKISPNWHTLFLSDLQDAADAAGRVHLTLDGTPVDLTLTDDPLTVWPHATDQSQLCSIPTFWFAWHAHHPQSRPTE